MLACLMTGLNDTVKFAIQRKEYNQGYVFQRLPLLDTILS